MDYFLAKNDKHLGICLRMLYANGFQGRVETVVNDLDRIEFHIRVTAEPDTIKELAAQYKILTS